VRIEVKHRDPAVPEHVGHALGVGKGDGVVATEHDPYGAGARYLLDG
jgi:hypothetical protein